MTRESKRELFRHVQNFWRSLKKTSLIFTDRHILHVVFEEMASIICEQNINVISWKTSVLYMVFFLKRFYSAFWTRGSAECSKCTTIQRGCEQNDNILSKIDLLVNCIREKCTCLSYFLISMPYVINRTYICADVMYRYMDF